jgi:hypothetical protein
MNTLFLAGESFLAAYIVAGHRARFSLEAVQWLLLGIAAIWTFWIKVLIAHIRIRQCIRSVAGVSEDTDMILKEAAELAYNGLGFAGFVVLGFLFALWRVVGAR